MGIMDAGVEALALTKAIIEVVDTSEKQKGEKNISGAVAKRNDYASMKMKYSSIKTQIAMKAETSKLAMAAAAVSGMNIEGRIAVENLETKLKMIQDAVIRRYTVQFNPSSLRLSGSGGGMTQMTNYTDGSDGRHSGVSYGAAETYIEMSVQLVFDETNNMVAFPGDISGFNMSNVANVGITAGLNKLKGVDVSTHVQGFLASIRNRNTRRVAFCWGKMIYYGIVNRVAARYTLFNPSGKPVRATVDMSLVLSDPTINADNMGYWAERHADFFDENKSLSGNRNSIVNLSNFSR